MAKIRVLDDVVANQIAAGEVVERPASVVKELMENALDAGAKRIDVLLKEGGLERVAVLDDGVGMGPEDAVLCFSRHATSKLVEIGDLKALYSYGFRGEALASIASVAKVRLVTRQKDAAAATELRIEGGDVVSVGEFGAPVGTRIEVDELFFNTPARRKFLKKPKAESRAVEQVVRTLALGTESVAFRLFSDGKKIIDVPAAHGAGLAAPRHRARVVACLGPAVRDGLLPIEAETELIKVRGYLVDPALTRRDHRGIHLFVNGRPVNDSVLVQAVKLAYRPVLEPGRIPQCVLDVRMDPAGVDINVHPQKAEVRFAEQRRVQSHVIRLVGDALLERPVRPATEGPERTYAMRKPGTPSLFEKPAAARETGGDLAELHRARVRGALEKFGQRAGQGQTMPMPRMRAGGSGGSGGAGGAGGAGQSPWLPVEQTRPAERGDGHAPPAVEPAPGERAAGHVNAAAQPRAPVARGLADASAADSDGPHLVAHVDGTLFVLDKRRLAQAALGRELTQALTGAVGASSRPLLFPVQRVVSAAACARVEEEAATLAQAGLDLEVFGDDRVILRALPAGLDPGACEALIDGFAALLTETRAGDAAARWPAFLVEHVDMAGALPDEPAAQLALAAQLGGEGGRTPAGDKFAVRFSARALDRWFSA